MRPLLSLASKLLPMDAKILEQRKLTDELFVIFKKIMVLNTEIEAPFQSDMLLLLGQHRHTFEEQGVIDHKDCITTTAIHGTIVGVAGLLALLGDQDKQFRNTVIEVANYFSRKPKMGGGVIYAFH